MGLPDYIALLAIYITLIALIYQIRSTGKQLHLQNFTEYTQRYQEIMLNLPKNINSENFDIQDINKDGNEKAIRYFRAYYDLCSEEQYLKENGYVDKKVWKLWKDGMKSTFNKKAFKDAWEIIQEDAYFSEDFSRFVRNMREA